jgi:hypothetical protein
MCVPIEPKYRHRWYYNYNEDPSDVSYADGYIMSEREERTNKFGRSRKNQKNG